jgi:hypothetical protein
MLQKGGPFFFLFLFSFLSLSKKSWICEAPPTN